VKFALQTVKFALQTFQGRNILGDLGIAWSFFFFFKVNTKVYFMNEPLTMVPVTRNGNFQAIVSDVVL